ncbi:thioredoxin-like [Haliotis rubra]|uniref:thioredoxin-like n=1 Tax=Haliotis rubra TaxID=36100 RepID=UPI001EE6284C|nr:thioredoxin-like [Haliotis rubra]
MRVLDTKAEFDQILAGSPGKLIVVDFYATWCGPCVKIAPILKSLSEKYFQVMFFKVDVDNNSETSKACCISCMPTFKFYKNGQEVDKLEGADEEALEDKIRSNMK